MDMTVYMVSLPSNRLELWMAMESERFLDPVLREMYRELDGATTAVAATSVAANTWIRIDLLQSMWDGQTGWKSKYALRSQGLILWQTALVFKRVVR